MNNNYNPRQTKTIIRYFYLCLLIAVTCIIRHRLVAQAPPPASCVAGNHTVTNSCCEALLNQSPSDIVNWTQQQQDEWWQTRLKCVLKVYQNPHDYPNYLTMTAHRGYFRDTPENSRKAFQLAIDLGVTIVEVDVWETKDGVMVCGHDKFIGKTERSIVPERLKSTDLYKQHNNVAVNSLTLCEIRPDLCNSDDYVGIGSYKKENKKPANAPNKSRPSLVSFDCNCDPYSTTNPCMGKCEPAKGGKPEANFTQPIATLQEIFEICKGKVLVNIDKIDDLCPKDGNCGPSYAPYDKVYKEAIKAGLIDTESKFTQIIMKGKPSKIATAATFKSNFPGVDWNLIMYTPTLFDESPVSNKILSAWVNEPDFNCTGFELGATGPNSPLYEYIPYVKQTLKRNYIAFASYPEFCHHFFKDPRFNYDVNWNWFLSNEAHQPDVFITDRLEVMIELLNKLELNKL